MNLFVVVCLIDGLVVCGCDYLFLSSYLGFSLSLTLFTCS